MLRCVSSDTKLSFYILGDESICALWNRPLIMLIDEVDTLPSFWLDVLVGLLVVFLYGSIDLFNEALNKRQRLGYEHGLPEKNMFDVPCNCSKRFERKLHEIKTHDH